MLGEGLGILRSLVFGEKKSRDNFTFGKVMDTNDPEQMGRVRVRCAGFGDKVDKSMIMLPWAFPISPLAGVVSHGLRGVEQETIDAPVAYGMWNVPKTGSYVLVGCLDGDQSKRFYIGGLHPQYITSTLPHGRYIWGEESEDGVTAEGPLAVNEVPIEPLYSNMSHQFTAPDASLSRRAGGTPTEPRKDNAEYRTRGADMQNSAMDEIQTADEHNSPGNDIADHTPGNPISFENVDGSIRNIMSPGYGVDQANPTEAYGPDTGGINYDPTVYSWTTPGFHSFSMNDRYDQCRVRLRTTSGHQILLDDTNERIYISTAGGASYIEIDKVGNIDIFAEKNISTHAKGDINFYSDSTIRMQALKGFHFRTDDEFRIHSLKDFHLRSEQNIRTYSAQDTRMEADDNFHIVNRGVMYVRTTGNINIKTADQMRLQSNNRMSLKAQADFISGDAPQIHWNSAYAYPADDASWAHEKSAYWTTRVPDHEPWARVFMKPTGPEGTDNDGTQNSDSPDAGDSPDGNLPHDNIHIAAYEYTSTLVGKKGRLDDTEEDYTRNTWWQR